MARPTEIMVWGGDGDPFNTVSMRTDQGEFSFTVWDNGEVQISTLNTDLSNIVVLDGYGYIHKLVEPEGGWDERRRA